MENARPMTFKSIVLMTAFALGGLSAPLSAGSTFSLDSPEFVAGDKERTQVDQNQLTLTNDWDTTSTPLAPRYEMGFAFDAVRGKAVVFGGRDTDNVTYGDTWVFDPGSGWTENAPAGPPSPRYGHGFVWAGDKFFLFGGVNASGQYLQETWSYDLVADTWTFIATPTAPEARAYAAMAYDSDLNKIVLFGGQGSNGAPVDGNTWTFDVAASTWSSHGIVPFPSFRSGASMAYDASSRRMILFGGRGATWDMSDIKNDTWALDPAALSWEDRLTPNAPPIRSNSAMLYDPQYGQVFLFGGRNSISGSYLATPAFYDYAKNRWMDLLVAVNVPPGRYGHGMAYNTVSRQGVIFGGRQDVASSATRLYTIFSSGTWTSPVVDVWDAPLSTPTHLSWQTVAVTFLDQPAGTDMPFQLASSTDGISFDSFRGPDGSTETYYAASATPQAVWPGHEDRCYLQLRANLASTDIPARPMISRIDIRYDHAPFAPALTFPADLGRSNDSTPLFQWTPAVDPEGDALTYDLQVDGDPGFAAPAISAEGIPGGSSPVTYTSGTVLADGVWYWRVRAKDADGLYGVWSGTFSFTLDTVTPPSAITNLSAARPNENGAINLTWTFPGDDKGRVDNGVARVRFAAAPIDLEGDWTAASPERTYAYSADPGQTIQTLVTGLSQATTYYFALKTEDELGNLSAFSTMSPSGFTNAPPYVTLVRPVGGEIMSTFSEVGWLASDPNPGDELAVRLRLSNNGGASYDYALAGPFSGNTTFYMWNSNAFPNGSDYRIRVDVVDASSLTVSDASPANFNVDNVNLPPVVTFATAPAADQDVYGIYPVSWSVADSNLSNTHTYNLWLSSTSGAAFLPLIEGTTATTYLWQTRDWPNYKTFQLRVSATDSGAPPLSSTATTPVFGILNSKAPASFNLLKPSNSDFPSIFDLSFSWSPSVDPEGDGVIYELRYSTDPALSGGVVLSDLTATSYTPARGSLMTEATWYWEVSSRDSQQNITRSERRQFCLSRGKVKSVDGLMTVEVLSGLPPEGYLNFQDARSAQPDLLQRADQAAQGDRLIKVLSYPEWRVRFADLQGNELPSGDAVSRLTFLYATAPAGSVAGERPNGSAAHSKAPSPEADHLKISRLDAARARWESVDTRTEATPSGKALSAVVNGFSIFSVLASPTPDKVLSGVTNFPNPFAAGRESTRIRYVLTESVPVTIRIYTLWGDLVRVMEFQPGTEGGTGTPLGYTNEVLWDGKNGTNETVANGMYLAEIRSQTSNGLLKEIRRIGVLK